jgi:hypothetical protein
MRITVLPLLLLVVLLTSGLNSPVVQAAESFAFWPGKGAKRAPSFQTINEDHACGEVVIAKVSKLPRIGKGPLQSEKVVELNSRGKVIRRWPVPIDYRVDGIKADELFVHVGMKNYWIRPDGSFRQAKPITVSDMKMAHCELREVFADSEDAQCGKFLDLRSQKERTLGYEGPCT